MRIFIYYVMFIVFTCSVKNEYSLIGISSLYHFSGFNFSGDLLQKLEDSRYVKGNWIHNDPTYNQLLDSLIQFDKPLNDYPLERFDARIFIIKNQKDSLFISSMMILEHNENFYELNREMCLRFFKKYYEAQGEFDYK
jgi:hypothetical protein